MPISKSARKAQRSSAKKKEQNVKFKKIFKDALKKASEKTLSETQALIDKATKKNIIHRNKAARLKSTLAKKFGKNSIKKETAKPEKTVKPTKKVIKAKTKKAVK